MGDKELRSDATAALEDTEAVTTIKSSFAGQDLVSADSESTIIANTNGKSVFEKSQITLSKFGDTLATDAKNITNISDDFADADSKISKYFET